MRPYTTDSGATLDLDHLLVISPVYTDYGYTRPHMYHLTLAFGSSKIIGYDDEDAAKACHAKLLNTWSTTKAANA